LFEEFIKSVTNFTPVMMVGLGLLIGIQHAFEPDHVSAVGTQISQKKSKREGIGNILKFSFTKSSLVGLFWGAGHTTTLVIIGYLAYFLTINIQEEVFSSLELGVGAMLIFLGLSTVWRKKFHLRHGHPHQHSDGGLHYDTHDHSDADHQHNHKPYLIGMIHGLAGSGSLIAISASSFGNIEIGFAFIILVGLGSLVGMVAVSGMLGLPFLLTKRFVLLNKIFRYAISGASLAIGVKILLDFGLFGNNY